MMHSDASPEDPLLPNNTDRDIEENNGSEDRLLENESPLELPDEPMSSAPETIINRATVRLDSLDLLRGLIVAIMAWDHCKDFIASYKGNDGTSPSLDTAGDFSGHTEAYAGPLEMFSGRPVYFLARAVSHLCAPGFSFLMGVGMIMLKESRMKKSGWEKSRVCRFFVLRGLILILLGFVLRASFLILMLDPPLSAHFMKSSNPVVAVLFGFFQVMTSLGLSMIFAAPLVSFVFPLVAPCDFHRSNDSSFTQQSLTPVKQIWLFCGLFATIVLAVEQYFIWMAQGPDPGKAHMTDALTFKEIILRFTFVPGEFDTLPSQNYYPFVPWLAISLLGVAFGASLISQREYVFRHSGLYGIVLLLVFTLVRLFGGRYFNMRGWPLHEGREYPFISFFNICKYPPSVAYVLFTMGINLILLYFLAKIKEPKRNIISRSLLAFGKAPLTFYILHFYFICIFVVIFYRFTGSQGMPLQYVVFVWIGLLVLMKYICEKYVAFKSNTDVDSMWRFF